MTPTSKTWQPPWTLAAFIRVRHLHPAGRGDLDEVKQAFMGAACPLEAEET